MVVPYLTTNDDLDLVHLSTHSINEIRKFLLSRVLNGNKVFCVLFIPLEHK